MRILSLTENFPPETNAAATRVYERARYWADWGHEVTVITTAPNFPQGKLYEGYKNRWYQTEWIDGIKVVRMKSFIAPNRGTFRRLLDFLSFLFTGFTGGILQHRPDVVTATSPQFFTAVAGWLLGAARRVPFVFELGDIWPASVLAVGAMKPNLAMRIMEKFELFLYNRSAAIVALTFAFKKNLVSRGIDGDKVAVVMNGVELSKYGPRPCNVGLAQEWGIADSFVIGYIGTHGMAHRLQNVLDAADRLRSEKRIRILFVGDGAERSDLIASARERHLENVIFRPPEPKEKMPKIWSLCDVALVHLRNSPVFSEVVPSKLFEAMAMRIPILLAAPTGEASKILAREGVGLHIAAEEPDALAAAVTKLANDTDLRERLGAAGHRSAAKYTRVRQAEEMLQVLEIAAAGWGDRAGVGYNALC
jgi:glycosyltransferase involved in cell wall biosynthesis